ncbi:MAG: PHP domain-containing protein [Firmicutes bacterium HGW-Firmicutes-14]|jgi:hypothetical protein|nr:MAG: PHP domain-containing protein [Firmicutes bacterium HGW-Firmicutes-14]
MAIDLHIHTTASDGDIEPATIVKMATAAGLETIALADHETTSGFEPACQAGFLYGVKVIPAVEILTYYKDLEIHILGYFNDPNNKSLQKELAGLRSRRTACTKATVKKLREFGFDISWPDVRRLAQKDCCISKGHIIQAINNAGYIRNRSDAIEILKRYLNREGLAYTCHTYPFQHAVDLIKTAGGIPVLAHPGLVRDDDIVEDLCSMGVEGIEVYYHYFGPQKEERIARYNKLAEEKSLLKTGGSDYHGTYTPVRLGDNHVPFEEVIEFLKLFE